MDNLRLLFDPPASGAWNMAVDEALLETATISGLATLRFYSWEEPTLSLGYFQSAEDRSQHIASRDCPLVRRASGGGAIVHDRELTYSIARAQRTSRSSAAGDLYDTFHETLAETLAELGVAAALYRSNSNACERGCAESEPEPFLCFDRRSSGDVIVQDAKIAGSAQRRRRGAVLQHGSILLASSGSAPHLAGIVELTGRRLAAVELAACWKDRIFVRLGATASEGALTAIEQKRAQALMERRFGSPDFAIRR